MSKPRICKTCKWLRHRVEPCCSCSRWGRGKTDHYIPAEETLGEYLERKGQEDMDKTNMSTEQLLGAMRYCVIAGDCTICPCWNDKTGCSFEGGEIDLLREAYKHLERLQQELIDERDRYDRLVSFELEEAELLRAAKNDSAGILRCAQNDKPLAQGGENTSSTADAVPLPLKGKANEGWAEVVDTSSTADERDNPVKRCAEYIAEKHLQMDGTEWHIIPGDYWRHICGINAKQEAKGRAKYGQSLEENTTLCTVQRIEHAQEELIDALKYLEHLKAAATDKLTANDYQRMAMRTAGEYDTDYDQLRNAAYGLNGEAGEVIDLLKKHEFQGHDLSDEKLIDECGDVLWYCALLADALGFSLEQVMNRNIDKLRKRYPDGFDKARSINREGEQ